MRVLPTAVLGLWLLGMFATPVAQAGEPFELHEGWNRLAWDGTQVEGAPGVVRALDASVQGEWLSVARYEDGVWRQAFPIVEIGVLNTLDSLDPGGEYWVFVEAEAAIQARATASPVIATFEVAEVETYRIELTEEADIGVAYQLAAGLPAPAIPNGLIAEGDGGVNAPWSWHIDPASLEFAEVTIEVCDGLPSYVEDGSLTSDYFCPWSARVVDLDVPAP
jgi:hypothetical protein